MLKCVEDERNLKLQPFQTNALEEWFCVCN